MELFNSENLLDPQLEDKLFDSLVDENGKINESELDSLIYRIKCVWLQRPDKLHHSEIDYLIWVHERFTYGEAELPVPLTISLQNIPLIFGVPYGHIERMLKDNIKEWLTNTYKQRNPTFFDKVVSFIFKK